MIPQRLVWNRFMGKLPPNSKSVMRNSKYGNIYKLSEYSLEESLELYTAWLYEKLKIDPSFLDDLLFLDYIACSCKKDSGCHADILIDFLNKSLNSK